MGEEERVLAGKATILEELAGLTFEISSNSFFQTNTEQAELLLQVAMDALALQGSERVLDVYAGTGTFTLPVARHAAEAIGIESAEVAVRAHTVLGLRDLSRTDAIVTPAGEVEFLEVNVSPGMTETSLLPMSVQSAGLELGAVCATLLRRAAAR